MMRHLRNCLAPATLAALMLIQGVTAHAGVISSGSFNVGVDDSGALYDGNTGIGFQRVSDGFDPLSPGTPRDSWGISQNGAGFYSDPFDFGVTTTLVSAVFGASTATIISTAGDLTVTQAFSFVAANVILDQVTVTNNAGFDVTSLFQRNVDWDVDPTPFNEFSRATPFGAPVIDTTYDGFENPDPTVAYNNSAGAGGGTFGPSDLGGGIKIDLGTIGAGLSTTFSYYYGISQDGQSPASLAAQVAALGGNTSVTTYSSDGDFNAATNSAIIAFASPGVAVPEPSTLVGGTLAAGLFLVGLRRRNRKQS